MRNNAILEQCRKDVGNLAGALNKTRDHTRELIIDEIAERGAVKGPETDVIHYDEHGDPLVRRIFSVKAIVPAKTRDDASLEGYFDDDEKKTATISIYEAENPEALIAMLAKEG